MAVIPSAPATGLTKSKLQLATAESANVLAGKTFYAKDKTLKTGTMVDRGLAQYGGVGSSGDYIAINALPEGYYHSDGNSWAPEARALKSKFGNAQAGQVLSGYTFTSAAGLRVTGTRTQNQPGQIAYMGISGGDSNSWHSRVIISLADGNWTSFYVSTSGMSPITVNGAQIYSPLDESSTSWRIHALQTIQWTRIIQTTQTVNTGVLTAGQYVDLVPLGNYGVIGSWIIL